MGTTASMIPPRRSLISSKHIYAVANALKPKQSVSTADGDEISFDYKVETIRHQFIRTKRYLIWIE